MICNVCKVDKVRIWSGRKEGAAKVYIEGEGGKRWRGRKCPACVFKHYKANPPKRTFIKRPKALRKCRKCDTKLRANYFHCFECTRRLPEVCDYAQAVAC